MHREDQDEDQRGMGDGRWQMTRSGIGKLSWWTQSTTSARQRVLRWPSRAKAMTDASIGLESPDPFWMGRMVIRMDSRIRRCSRRLVSGQWHLPCPFSLMLQDWTVESGPSNPGMDGWGATGDRRTSGGTAVVTLLSSEDSWT
jgi:hypothetical protein